MSADAISTSNLRAKYLDWCTGQVADSFLRLTPEEVFALAERATGGEGVTPSDATSRAAAGDVSSAAVALWRHLSGSAAGGGGSSPASYQAAVAQIAEVLAAQLQLPSFEVWTEAYRSDPARYEADLLGFRVAAGGAEGEPG